MSDADDITTTSPAPPSVESAAERPYEGWKEIADALNVSEDTAQEYANRPYMPLVVFTDHAGRVWTPRSCVRDFINLHHLPLWAHRALKKAKLLPSQVKTAVDSRRRKRRPRHRGR